MKTIFHFCFCNYFVALFGVANDTEIARCTNKYKVLCNQIFVIIVFLTSSYTLYHIFFYHILDYKNSLLCIFIGLPSVVYLMMATETIIGLFLCCSLMYRDIISTCNQIQVVSVMKKI